MFKFSPSLIIRCMTTARNNSASGQPRGTARACVIGAGPAGLVCAKTLIQAGFDVTVYEKGSFAGGTWVYGNDNGRQFLYRNLHINTSKALTQFSDFPFPQGTQPIPDHKDMAAYFDAYARRNRVWERIRFRTEVIRVEPAPRGEGWEVETAAGIDRCDFVVVAAGAFARPAHAQEFQRFAGTYIHSADYREPERFVAQRVCIVGCGNSAVDIASDICTTAARTVLIARSGVFVQPHFAFGLPFGDLVQRFLRRRWIPAALRRKLISRIVHAVHGPMASHGFKPLTHRVHPTISSTIIQDILFRRVEVKHGVRRVDGRTLIFEDGSSAEFDCVIGATGYITEFPFIAQSIVDTSKGLKLYKRIVAPSARGLYFVGMINLDVPINHACEMQSRWIAAVERDDLELPDEKAMHADIAKKQRWLEKNYGTASRHALQEDSDRYYRELKSIRRLASVRAAFGSVLRIPPRSIPSHHHIDTETSPSCIASRD